MYGLREGLLEEIRAFANQHQVKRVYLFGSRARGDYHERSDIDLAVDGGDFDGFAMDIDEETSTLLMFDIVNLNRPVQLELRSSIQQEGRVIYAQG